MTWPVSQDYNEAIQHPGDAFADADLRRGEAAVNALGIPQPRSGNFADVYEVRGPAGQWAVKCFTRQVPRLRERYAEISRALHQARLPFTVDFRYLEEGIFVAGCWRPVLKMQWVEGLTLNQFVAQAVDRPAALESLLQIWLRMAKHLRMAGIAHCDLQHGNVLLVPGSGSNSLALKLIDYDGMWVPLLAGVASGEVGHPSYQHPQRLRDGTYSPAVDRFPLLLVATALRALMAGGRPLWERYDNGDNLLFRESDLREPHQSELIRDLFALDDPATTALVERVIDSLEGGLESAPPLDEVLADARHAHRFVGVSRATAVSAVMDRGNTADTAVAHRPDPWDSCAPPDAMEFSTAFGPRGRRRSSVGAILAGIVLITATAGSAAAWAVAAFHPPAAARADAAASPLPPPAVDCIIQLRPGRRMATRELIGGPVEITVVARGDAFFQCRQGSDVLIIWDARTQEKIVHVRRPHSEEPSAFTDDAAPFLPGPDGWNAYACTITQAGMTVSVNGRAIAPTGRSDMDVSGLRTYELQAKGAQMLDVKSFTVRPLQP